MIPLDQLVPGVRSTGESLVFEVQSDSRPSIWHRVDLAAYSGHGRCECERFTCCLGPRIKRVAVPDARHECHHIRSARRYLAIAVAQHIIRQRTGQPNIKMPRDEWAHPAF